MHINPISLRAVYSLGPKFVCFHFGQMISTVLGQVKHLLIFSSVIILYIACVHHAMDRALNKHFKIGQPSDKKQANCLMALLGSIFTR